MFILHDFSNRLTQTYLAPNASETTLPHHAQPPHHTDGWVVWQMHNFRISEIILKLDMPTLLSQTSQHCPTGLHKACQSVCPTGVFHYREFWRDEPTAKRNHSIHFCFRKQLLYNSNSVYCWVICNKT